MAIFNHRQHARRTELVVRVDWLHRLQDKLKRADVVDTSAPRISKYFVTNATSGRTFPYRARIGNRLRRAAPVACAVRKSILWI